MTDLMTTRELARRLRVTPETVLTWARRGTIPTVRLSRKVVRYDAGAVLAALSIAPASAKGVARG